MSYCGFCGSSVQHCQCDWCEDCNHLKRYCVCPVESEAEFGDFDTPEDNERARELIRKISE